MNRLFKTIDRFEARVITLFIRLFKLIDPKSVEDLDHKIKYAIKHHENLIEQYNLVQSRKSGFSRIKREQIQLKVAHLISKGHIKINS